MPTGYTHNVGDGTLTEFRDFALQCARAFGALITMRDDPADAPIPDAIEASSYYSDRLKESEAQLFTLNEMGDDEVIAAAQKDNDDSMAAYRKRLAEDAATRDRYLAMLEHVRAWEPPTHDHAPMKEFMVEQLMTSIDCDCGHVPKTPRMLTPTEWLNERREDLKQGIARYREQDQAERKRAADRTAWIAALKASLQEGHAAEGERMEAEARQ